MKTTILNWEEKRPVATFFALCLLIAWPFIILSGYSSAGNMGDGVVSQIFRLVLPIAVAQFSPSIAAFILVGLRFGRAGIRDLASRMWQRGYATKWLLIAVFLPFAIIGISLILLIGTGMLPRPNFDNTSPLLVFPAYLLFLTLGILIGGISEEFGWRGYLLPILQRRYTAFVSAAIVGTLWAVWHLEPDPAVKALFTDGWGVFAGKIGRIWLMHIYHSIALTIVYVWIFNNTNGRLLPMMLLHSSHNALQTMAGTLWPSITYTDEIVYFTMWWVVAIVLLVWQGGKTLSRINQRWTGEEHLLPSVWSVESK